MHASLNNKVITSTRHPAESFDFPILSPVFTSCRYPLLTESPFAHSRCYLFWDSVKHCLTRSYPIFIAHTGSCARPNTSGHLSFTLACPVFAGCYESLLVDGPSRHYLYNLCIGAWIHTPLCSLSAFTHFFLRDVSLTFAGTRSAHKKTSAFATSAESRDFGAAIIRLSSGSHTCSTFRLLPPHFWAARPYTPRIARTVTLFGMWHHYVFNTGN